MSDSCGDDRFGTWSGASSVRARFERGVQSGANSRITSSGCRLQRNNLSVGIAGGLRGTFVHRAIGTNKDSTHPRIRTRVQTRCLSHMHGTAHERLVISHVVSLLPSGL